MGVFFRKSFKAGPVRFNLSKSGIGVSTGVKGLRIGTGPRGTYISGGTKGVYFRHSLTSQNRRSQSAAALTFSPDVPAEETSERLAPQVTVPYSTAGGYALPIIIGLFGGSFLLSSLIGEAAANSATSMGAFFVVLAIVLGRRTAICRRDRGARGWGGWGRVFEPRSVDCVGEVSRMPTIDFAELRRRVPIARVLVLVAFRPLRRSGAELRGPCPIHQAASPHSGSSRARSAA